MPHLSDKSIKKQIRSLIFSSLVLTVGMIVFIILYYWNNSIKETMVYTQQETTQAVLQRIKTFIDIPLAINERNRYFIENGLINIKDVNNDAKFLAVSCAVPMIVFIVLVLAQQMVNIMVYAAYMISWNL